jgi:hypothetical protein
MSNIPASELTNRAMVAGNEKVYKVVIDQGYVKEWVGFGWIDLRKATPSDLKKHPTVTRGKC